MRSYALATMDVEQPGQDNVSKLLWANWHRELGEIAMDVQGMAGLTLENGEFDEWQRLYLFSARTPSTAGPTRFSATSSPSACSAYPERSRDESVGGPERD